MSDVTPRLVTPDDVAMVRALARWSLTCRELLGLSQCEVGRQAGRSQGAISRVESGLCYATPLVTYRALARLYVGLGLLTDTPLPPMAALLGKPDGVDLTIDPQRKALLAAFDECPPSRRAALVEVVRAVVGLAQHPLPTPSTWSGVIDPSLAPVDGLP